MTYDLLPRQREVEPLLLSGSAVLWWEMRLGKTRAVLNAFDSLWQEGGPRTLVVVAPEIAKTVWVKEAEEMGLQIPATRFFGRTRKDRRGETIEGLPRLLVVNWDILPAWVPELRDAWRTGGYVLVLDETHGRCTNPQTQSFKAAKMLSELADRTWVLTGTLYRKNALDIYWQLKLLGARANPFQLWSPQKFGEAFCEVAFNPWRGRVVIDKNTGMPATFRNGLVKRAGGNDFSGLRDEHQLLSRLGGVIDKRVEDGSLGRHRIPRWVGEEEHPYTGEDGGMGRARTELIPLKILKTVDYLNSDIQERPVVIAGWHREYLEGLRLRLGCPVINGTTSSAERGKLIAEFQAGQHPVLGIQIISGGMSIDLSRARHILFGEIDWDYTNLFQMEARTRGPRQQATSTVAHYLMIANSVEEYVWNVKLEKGNAIGRLDKAHQDLVEAG